MTRKILRMSLVEMTNILVRSKCFSRNKLFLELFIELRTLFYCFVFPFHLSFFLVEYNFSNIHVYQKWKLLIIQETYPSLLKWCGYWCTKILLCQNFWSGIMHNVRGWKTQSWDTLFFFIQGKFILNGRLKVSLLNYSKWCH